MTDHLNRQNILKEMLVKKISLAINSFESEHSFLYANIQVV